MRCFQHIGSDAVGVCVACGRALCPACARKSQEDLVVCSDECERSVHRAALLRVAEAERFGLDARYMRGAGLIWRLLGVACTLAGLFNLFLTFVMPRFGPFRGAMKPVPSIGFAVLMFLLTAIFVSAARLARVLSERYSRVEREFHEP